MARTPYRIELSEAEERELRRRARQQTRAYREVLRAKIVLLAAEGLDNAEIARRLDTTREAVSRWRKRFHEERLQGLEDRPRAGRGRRGSPPPPRAVGRPTPAPPGVPSSAQTRPPRPGRPPACTRRRRRFPAA